MCDSLSPSSIPTLSHVSFNVQDIEEYANLPDDLCGAAKRWQEWLELERPEDEPLPGEYTISCSSNSIVMCRF